MARSRDFLARFRPVGTPGSAAAAGVPVDRGRELAAELGPLLAELEETQGEADAIRARALAEADRRRRDAEVSAHALLVAGRDEAQAERTALLDRARADAEAAADEVVGSARSEAAAIERRVAARLPTLVDQVQAAVRGDLLDDAPSPP